jgi:MFS family permease
VFTILIGFPQAFPIFQTFLSSGDSAPYGQSFVLSLLAPGLQDIEEGIIFQILPKAVKYRQMLVIAGIFTITVAMILASYASTVWHTVLSQGVLFGVGGIMLNYVHVSVFSEWFDKKQGEAMGIIWLGYRLGALAFPLICQWLLDKHGYARTLRVLIAPMLALLVPSIVLLRGRYSAATVVSSARESQVSKLAAIRTPNVLFYLFVSLLFDFVVNVPKMFITSYGADLGLDSSDRALALSLLVLSNMLGTFGLGWLSNGGFYENLVCICAIATSMAHILVWGFANTRFGVFTYALIVGLTSGGRCFSPGLNAQADHLQASTTAYSLSTLKCLGRTESCLLRFTVSLVSFEELRFSQSDQWVCPYYGFRLL